MRLSWEALQRGFGASTRWRDVRWYTQAEFEQQGT